MSEPVIDFSIDKDKIVLGESVDLTADVDTITPMTFADLEFTGDVIASQTATEISLLENSGITSSTTSTKTFDLREFEFTVTRLPLGTSFSFWSGISGTDIKAGYIKYSQLEGVRITYSGTNYDYPITLSHSEYRFKYVSDGVNLTIEVYADDTLVATKNFAASIDNRGFLFSAYQNNPSITLVSLLSAVALLCSWLSNGTKIGTGNPFIYTPLEAGEEDITLAIEAASDGVESCEIGESYLANGVGDGYEPFDTAIFSSVTIDAEGQANFSGNATTINFGIDYENTRYMKLEYKFMSPNFDDADSIFRIRYNGISYSILEISLDSTGPESRYKLGGTSVVSVYTALHSEWYRQEALFTIEVTIGDAVDVILTVDCGGVVESISTTYSVVPTGAINGYANGFNNFTAILRSMYIVGSGLPNQCQGSLKTYTSAPKTITITSPNILPKPQPQTSPNIAFFYEKPSFSDIQFNSSTLDLERHYEIETAVILALFLDERVTEEELPPGQCELRGWYGDELLGVKSGSKAWTLERAKCTNRTATLLQGFYLDALQRHLIDDGLAKNVVVEAKRIEKEIAFRIAIQVASEEYIYVRFNKKEGA